MNKFERVLSNEDLLDVYRSLDNPKRDRDSVIEAMSEAVDAAIGKLAEKQPDVTHLLKALERIANMDIMTYHNLDSAKITARNALAYHSIPYVSPTIDNTACVSEKEESETQENVPFTPKTVSEMRSFIGMNFDSLQYANPETEEPDEMDRYTLTIHDLLSAFSWAGHYDCDHIPDTGKRVAEMYWINPDYPSSDSIIEAFEPITSSVEVNVGDRYEVSCAIRLPDMMVEVTELEENEDVKAYRIVEGDHIPDAKEMIVPDGWQLAPKEPSRDMLKKMFYEIFGMDGIEEEYLAARYRNMLSSFPKYTGDDND